MIELLSFFICVTENCVSYERTSAQVVNVDKGNKNEALLCKSLGDI